MADVTLAPQSIDKSGAAPTFTAIDATDTYYFINDSKTLLYFKNTGSEATVTMISPVTQSGLAVADPTLTVPATTGERVVAFQPTSVFNNTSGKASFTQDIASGVTVAVVRAA